MTICDVCGKAADRVAQELDADTEKIRDAAARIFACSEISIPDDADIATTDMGDAWVEAWVFVRKSEL